LLQPNKIGKFAEMIYMK